MTSALNRSRKSTLASTDEFPQRFSIRLLAGVCLIAIVVSSYLAWVALTSSKVAGCGGGRWFDCGHVISSRWSLWMGIPVSLLALGLYVLLGTSLYLGGSTRFPVSIRRAGWAIVTLLALSAGMAACWFIIVQVFVIRHLCSYCMIAHCCGLVAAGIVIWKKPVGEKAMNPILLIAACGFAVLIGGQLISEPPATFKIETFETPPSEGQSTEFEAPLNSTDDSANDNVFEAPATPPNDTDDDHSSRRRPAMEFSPISLLAALRPGMLLNPRQSQSKNQEQNKSAKSGTEQNPATERRLVSIIGGTVKLDVAQWPIVGSQKAKYVFVEMFDYACPHCRKTHVTIKGAAAKLNGDLATIVLPIPLNTACNSSTRNTDPKFAESCEVAKLAVAVWRADPSKFSDFHNWMFTGDSSPTYAAAKARAETLVDAAKLAAELNSALPGQYITKSVELYRRSGAGNVPKLMFPGTSIVGEFTSIDALVNVIVRENK